MSGAVNEYSTRVLVGNWLEDSRGSELARAGDAGTAGRSWTSNTQEFMTTAIAERSSGKAAAEAASARAVRGAMMHGQYA